MYGDENQKKTQVVDILRTQNSRVLSFNTTVEIFKFPKAITNGVAFKNVRGLL